MRFFLWKNSRRNAELSEEIRGHIAMAVADRVARGERRDDAEAAVRREFGNVPMVRETTRDMWAWRWWDHLSRDAGYAIRGLARAPGLTVVIVLCLAVGVGANTSIFSLLDRVYFRPPPGVSRPQEVRRIYERDFPKTVARWITQSVDVTSLTPFRAATHGLADLEGYAIEREHSIGAAGDSITVAYATEGYFRLLGVTTERGRFFGADENREGDPRRVAVISDRTWRARFGSDPAIIGRAIRIDHMSFVVVGVAAAGFEGVDLDAVSVWLPLAVRPLGSGGPGAIRILARMHRGAAVAAVDRRLTTEYQRERGPLTSQVDSASVAFTGSIVQARGPIAFSPQDARDLSLSWRLAWAAVILLVIAVSNVASLLLMRALRRRQEIAIRVALGISRRRLIGQLAVEVAVLGGLSAAVALVFARWSAAVLRGTLLADVRWSSTVIDGRLVMVTIGVATAAAMMAGLAPLVVALRTDVGSALKSGSRWSGRDGRSRIGSVLLVTQAALCMVLLAGAGAFAQSFRRATSVDLGYDRDRLIIVNGTAPAGAGSTTAALSEVIRQIASLQSVEAVGGGSDPLRRNLGVAIRLPNGDSVPRERGPAPYIIDSGYFRAAGLRMIRGRPLDARDVHGAEPVAVIDETMASQLWPGQNPVGQCFSALGAQCRRVVGIVQDVRAEITDPPYARFYVPWAEIWPGRVVTPLLVRTRGVARVATTARVRQIVNSLSNAGWRRLSAERMTDRLAPQYQSWRIAALLFGAAGALALLCASAGIYGLVGLQVVERTREIGIRLAVGAPARSVVATVITSGLRLALVGVGLGLLLALAAGRTIASMMFNTSPFDPVVLVATATVLGIATIAASFLPAWRAARIDPAVTLRAD